MSETGRAYGKGYSAGSRHHWPEHRPPVPPHPIIASLMAALRNLRDQADSACATIDADDEFVKRLAPAIEDADEALSIVGRWLKTDEAAAPERR